MKKRLVFTVMLVIVSTLGFSQTTWMVNNLASWTQAVNGIRGGGNNKQHTITVNGTISVPSSAESTFGYVSGVTVTIASNGTLSLSNNGSLLRIGARQTVIVRDITLQGRNTNNASVVIIAREGIFRMEGNASVSGNSSSHNGGGVLVEGGTFIMQGSASVFDNTSNNDGGGVYVKSGTFAMQGNASVSGNITNYFGRGGGVYVEGGTFAMHGSASVSGNTASEGGGGGGVGSGTFTMQGNASVSGNKSNSGGGVLVNESGIFTMQGNASVSGNTAGAGGGVFVSENGTFTMQDNASVSGNTAGGGGGVVVNHWRFFAGGEPSEIESKTTFIMRGNASISGNTSDNSGGGVSVNLGTFTMQGSASVSGNKSNIQGGGVYVGENGTFTKTSGTIYGDDAEQNLKNTVISRTGHAVYKSGNWRNISAGSTMNTGSRNFWLNDGNVVTFPSGFTMGQWNPPDDFNNYLFLTENTIILTNINRSSNSYTRSHLWVLQRISGNVYTFKRADAANTMTLTIRLEGRSLVISGDNGSDEISWNGTWQTFSEQMERYSADDQ